MLQQIMAPEHLPGEFPADFGENDFRVALLGDQIELFQSAHRLANRRPADFKPGCEA
jgi:hypothetical protein